MSVRIIGSGPVCCTPSDPCINTRLFSAWTQKRVGAGGTVVTDTQGNVTLTSNPGGFIQIQDLLSSIDPTRPFCITFKLQQQSGSGLAVGLSNLSGNNVLELADNLNPALDLVWSNSTGSTDHNGVGTIDTSFHIYKICRLKNGQITFRMDKLNIQYLALTSKFPNVPVFPTLLVGSDASTVVMSYYCAQQR